VAGGIDGLTLIRESNIRVQLPCNERNFHLEMPCIVETIEKGEYLTSVSSEDRANGLVDKPDLQAQFIRLLSLRRKVLRYVVLLYVITIDAKAVCKDMSSVLICLSLRGYQTRSFKIYNPGSIHGTRNCRITYNLPGLLFICVRRHRNWEHYS
jgi:hypothetical protein